jgi:hypothetical protein
MQRWHLRRRAFEPGVPETMVIHIADTAIPGCPRGAGQPRPGLADGGTFGEAAIGNALG